MDATMTAENHSDQRQAERHAFSCDVSAKSGHQFFTGFSENISAGGLFIATYQTLPLGSRFTITFSVPGVDHEFEAHCVVRWLREYDERDQSATPGMGVSFENLSEREVQILNAILGRVETIFYDD
jgi:uncharacterized protein (TIGR02266 family)